MPIYEYECGDCGHNLEHLQRVSEDPLVKCPQCGQASLQRLISMPGFRLKGTGWYVTDFKDSGKSAKPESDSSATNGFKAEAKSNSDTSTTSSADSTKTTTDSTS